MVRFQTTTSGMAIRDEIVTPGKTKVVSGEGMPQSNDPTTRGDLVIEFSIQFPTSLNMQQKQSLKQILH